MKVSVRLEPCQLGEFDDGLKSEGVVEAEYQSHVLPLAVESLNATYP